MEWSREVLSGDAARQSRRETFQCDTYGVAAEVKARGFYIRRMAETRLPAWHCVDAIRLCARAGWTEATLQIFILLHLYSLFWNMSYDCSS